MRTLWFTTRSGLPLTVISFLNTVLIGAFAFAGIQHFFVWRTSRPARLPLLVATYSMLSAVQMVGVAFLSTTRNIGIAQVGLETRATFGLAGTLVLAWLIAELTHFRPRKFLLLLTIVMSAGVIANLIVSITGTVTGFDEVAMPWGETVQVIQRRPGIPAITVPVYLCVLSVYAFAAAAGIRWAKQDRLAGILTAIAGLSGILITIVTLLIDLSVVHSPYIGQAANALWILLATILLSREHAAREERLEASEAHLAASEARYRTLIESAPEAIVVFDIAAQCFADVNAEACRLFGAPLETLLKLNPFLLSPLVQADGRASETAAAEYIQQAVSGHTPVFEWTHRTIDGRDFPCEVRLVLLPDPRRLLVRGSITDISGRRQLEDQLRQSQKMEAIGQLAGGVAHDFNNLLTVITGYAELLHQQLPGSDPRSGLVKAIGDTAERAGWLTARLLAFGRRAVLTPQVFDLNVLVSDGEHILRRLIGEHIRLSVTPSVLPLHVKIDPGQWSQLMLNLAINARDAMPAGGAMSLRTFSHVLNEARPDHALEPGHYAAFAIADTGLGMSPDVRQRIFEPFFTTKEAGRGTGLGLAVVHGIVTQAGGAIDVETGSGRGTMFTVYLPIAEGAPEPAPSGATLDSLGAGETVLLVEDEATLREMLEASLSARGFHVLGACDGDDAMRILETTGVKIDLLVTDMVMPGRYNGRALADVVRARFSGVKVLFISGYIDDPLVRATGFNDGEQILQKPFSLAAIAQKARQMLDAG